MHRQFARQFVSAPRRFDRINVADEICDSYIWGRQFFHVTLFRREIRDRRALATLRNQIAAAAANRRIGIIVNLASGDVWHLRIKQSCQRTKHAALRLSAQSQKNEIVPRENGVNDLRNDGVFVDNNSAKNGLALTEPGDEFVAQFILDPARPQFFFGERTSAQFAKGAGKTHHATTPETAISLQPSVRPERLS